MSVRIEIGGGTKPLANYIQLDPIHGEGKWKRRAQDGMWPQAADTVRDVYASHVLEHIPSGNPRIDVFNEAWRVLKPEGRFEIVLPLVGWTDPATGEPRHTGWQPWADPTHVSFWWFPESLLYFCVGPFKAHADYGTRDWHLEHWEVRGGFEGYARLRPAKG